MIRPLYDIDMIYIEYEPDIVRIFASSGNVEV